MFVVFIVVGVVLLVFDRYGIDVDCVSDIGEKIFVGNFFEVFDFVMLVMIDVFLMVGMFDDVVDWMDVVFEYVDGVVVGLLVGFDFEEVIIFVVVVYCLMN